MNGWRRDHEIGEKNRTEERGMEAKGEGKREEREREGKRGIK